MTNELNGVSETTPSNESVPAVSQPAPASAEEKLIPQSKANGLFDTGYAKGYEKARREFEQNSSSQTINSHSQPSSIGGMTQIPDEVLEQRIATAAQKQIEKLQQEAFQKAQEHQAGQIVNEFHSKLAAGASEFPELQQKIAVLDLPKIPNVVHMVSQFDNVAAMINDLGDRPLTAFNLNKFASENPVAAFAEFKILSDSIKANKAALEQKQPREPLSQVKHSMISDNGSKTITSRTRDPLYKV